MIIHKLIYKKGEKFYMCNQAISPIHNKKYSLQWKNVSCKNCLKQKVKMNKPIKKWIPSHYKKVYVRGHYVTAKIEYVETITKPVVINFKGKDGKLIKFNAIKCIKKPLKVNFHKIKKTYKSK